MFWVGFMGCAETIAGSSVWFSKSNIESYKSEYNWITSNNIHLKLLSTALTKIHLPVWNYRAPAFGPLDLVLAAVSQVDLTEPLESKSGVLVLTEMQPEAAAGVSLPPKIREEKKKDSSIFTAVSQTLNTQSRLSWGKQALAKKRWEQTGGSWTKAIPAKPEDRSSIPQNTQGGRKQLQMFPTTTMHLMVHTNTEIVFLSLQRALTILSSYSPHKKKSSSKRTQHINILD